MYQKILTPLDGSKFAEAALPLAITLSRKTGASLHVATVLEPVSTYVYDGWETAAVEWSEAYLAEVTERLGAEGAAAVTTAVLTGHAVECLLDEAREQKADLVIMASHGRGPLSRMWLGSVADGFARGADRPVLVVRPDDETGAVEPLENGFGTVLVPLDGSELSECALQHAVELGSLFGASYHLTRVVSYPFDIASPYLPHTVQSNQDVVEEARRKAAEYLERHADRLRNRDLSVTTAVVVDAQAGHGILSEASDVDASLIAMATHGHKGLRRAILGSTADKVLRGTHDPVLLYRAPHASG